MRNQLETEQTPNEWDYWMCQVWENKECWLQNKLGDSSQSFRDRLWESKTKWSCT